jgi:hypothetical protein
MGEKERSVRLAARYAHASFLVDAIENRSRAGKIRSREARNRLGSGKPGVAPGFRSSVTPISPYQTNKNN